MNPSINAVAVVLGERALDAARALGLKALAGAYPRRDAPVVERLRAAGAIPIGRTNCPTFTLRWHTDSELWGATLNPWDRSRTPSGVSVLKPTLGRIPHASTIEPVDAPIGVQLTAVEGPMARRIADLRTALAALAGPSWRDPHKVTGAPDPLTTMRGFMVRQSLLRARAEFQEERPLIVERVGILTPIDPRWR